MTPWIALCPVAVVMGLGAWMSYTKAARDAAWYTPAMCALCVANALLWSWATRRAGDGNQIFALSIAWDVVVIAAYNVLPVALLGVRLTPAQWVGFAVVVLGAFMVKLGA